jgi:hypothetical protein
MTVRSTSEGVVSLGTKSGIAFVGALAAWVQDCCSCGGDGGYNSGYGCGCGGGGCGGPVQSFHGDDGGGA